MRRKQDVPSAARAKNGIACGRVVDYLDFQIWPFVFNFADSMIVVGVGLFMLRLYLEEKAQGKSILEK